MLNRLVRKRRSISNKIALIAADLSDKALTADIIEEEALRHDFIIKPRGLIERAEELYAVRRAQTVFDEELISDIRSQKESRRSEIK
jgi:hypothetical protein